ncbi:11869_t:CDS:1 [Ambispora leptoticha]|uniref:11869_t:CDS:1 n=1 Tax=Ambispora leptoticha TaxID=144679 RepID=A0A9N9F3E2_9GLOM|nr:11869_t:CDS:1 [Ambispora leptoticha]
MSNKKNSIIRANSSNRKDANDEIARFLAEPAVSLGSGRKDASDEVTRLLAGSAVSLGLSQAFSPKALIIGGIAAWAANKVIQKTVEDDDIKEISQFVGDVGLGCALTGAFSALTDDQRQYHNKHKLRGIPFKLDCKICNA